MARAGSGHGHKQSAEMLALRLKGWFVIQLPEQELWSGIPTYYKHASLPVLAFINDGWGLGDPFSMQEIYERFAPRGSDVHIVTYPKAGTSWIAEVAWLVDHDANVGLAKSLSSDERTVFVELSSPHVDKLSLLETAADTRHVKWHHCAELLPERVVKSGRIIYLLRNPKDTVVSWFHFQSRLKLFGFTGTFDQFFDLFVRGDVAYGSYMHHALSWWAHRHRPNVLFLTYEHMHRDLPAVVRTVAHFLGKSLSEEQVARIVVHCSFEQMKQRAGAFMRRGRVGDWRNYLSQEQSDRMDEWVEQQAASESLPLEFDLI